MRTLITAAILAAAALTAAAQPAGQDDRYVIRLDPAAAIDRVDVLAAQLAAAHGATIVSTASATDDTIVLRVSPSRVRTLKADPRVQSVTSLKVAAEAIIEPVNWSVGVPYTYDGAGSVKTIGNGTEADAFVYDAVGRLVQAKVNLVTRTYEYDAFGNRKTCASAGTDCQYTIAIDSRNNRLVETPTIDHDDAGQVTKFGTHTYTYDAANMMTSDQSSDGSSSKVEYLYTADDERLATFNVAAGTWDWTVRDTGGKVLREFFSNSTGTWQWKRDYVYRDGRLLASRVPFESTATTHHYHLDHLGTPRRVTGDDDRIIGYHDYYAFGPELGTSLQEPNATDLKYAGHEREPGSDQYLLDYMHARYYNPTLGRFLSPDRKAGSARPDSPQTWNRYAYVTNDPMKYFDPDGDDLHISFDFSDVSLSMKERAFVMIQVRRRFTNAGVKTVNVHQKEGFFDRKPKEKKKTDRSVVMEVVEHDLEPLVKDEVFGTAGEGSREGLISTWDLRKLPREQFLNALINIIAHEIGHATGVLPEHKWDAFEKPKAEKGSIMDQGYSYERGAGLREFDREDAGKLRKGLNPP